MRKMFIIFGIGLLVLFFLFVITPAAMLGKIKALADINQGKLIVYQNRFAGASQTYKDTMQQKYGVTIIEGGDALSFGELDYNSGYNSVSIQAIEEKYEPGILKKVEDEINKKLEQEHNVSTEKIIETGRQKAKDDISKGQIKVYYVDSERSDKELIREIGEKHQIEFISKPKYENLPFYSGYNEVSMNQIKDKSGLDVHIRIKIDVELIAINRYAL